MTNPRSSNRFAAALAVLGAVLVALTGALAPATSGAATAPRQVPRVSGGGEWTTYGGAMTRASYQAHSPALRSLHRRWVSATLDGAIYGEPLIDAGLVLVATEADTVYALAASTGRLVWTRHLGTPVPDSALPCGNISPTIGVTSTMVLDPATGMLFVSGSLIVSGAVHHDLFALQTATGAEVWRRDLDQPGWSAPAQLQRAALALDSGEVLVGFGGNYGDCDQYHGYVVAVAEAGTGPTLAFKVPTQREGAIWAPSGIAVAPNGRIYVSTGNGGDQRFDESDSVIELSPGLKRLGVFAPRDWRSLSDSDSDLGSVSPVLLANNKIFILGKDTTAYLLSASRLGGIGGELASEPVCFSTGGDAYLPPLVFTACPGSAMSAVRVGPRSLRVVWRSGAADASPTIAGGIVWSLNGGNLVGLRPGTGAVLVTVPVVGATQLAAPSAGEGLVVVGGTSQVEALAGPHGWTGP